MGERRGSKWRGGDMTTCVWLSSPHLVHRRYWFHSKVIHSFSPPSTTLVDPLSSGLSNWDIHQHKHVEYRDLREEYGSRRKDLLLFVWGRQLVWTWWICCSLVVVEVGGRVPNPTRVFYFSTIIWYYLEVRVLSRVINIGWNWYSHWGVVDLCVTLSS